MRDVGLMRCLRFVFSLSAVGLSALGLNGCGSKVQSKPLPPPVDEKITNTDETKIKEYLDKAGMKGTPQAISDQGDHWLVEFQPELIKVEGRRPQPRGPESYKIDKASGKVESALGTPAP